MEGKKGGLQYCPERGGGEGGIVGVRGSILKRPRWEKMGPDIG